MHLRYNTWLLALVGLLLAACAFQSAYPIIEGLNGQTLSVEPGREVNLTLPGNPDADMDWVIEEVDAEILEPQGAVRYNAPAMAGTVGRLEWRFLAQREGETRLRLVRRGDKAWEAQGPFEVVVRVEK
jgi:predicted secreted protein